MSTMIDRLNALADMAEKEYAGRYPTRPTGWAKPWLLNMGVTGQVDFYNENRFMSYQLKDLITKFADEAKKQRMDSSGETHGSCDEKIAAAGEFVFSSERIQVKTVFALALLLAACAPSVDGHVSGSYGEYGTQNLFVRAGARSLCSVTPDATWIEVADGQTRVSLTGNHDQGFIGRVTDSNGTAGYECNVFTIEHTPIHVLILAECGTRVVPLSIEFDLVGCQ